MSKLSWKMVGVTLLTVVGILGAAQAATDGPYTVSIPLGRLNWSDVATLPQFDPTQGRLISVEVAMGVSFGDPTSSPNYVEVWNRDPRYGNTISSSIEGEVILAEPNGLSLSAATNGAWVDHVPPEPTPSTPTKTTHEWTDYGFDALTITDSTQMGPYVGWGNVNLPVNALAWQSVGGTARYGFEFVTRASAVVTVTYTYDWPTDWYGFTPGYWKNHTSVWPYPYILNPRVKEVFSVPATLTAIKNTDTLLNALGYGGGSGLNGAAKILLRAATAALLNEASLGDDYPPFPTVDSLIAVVNEALASNNRDTMLHLANVLDYWNNSPND